MHPESQVLPKASGENNLDSRIRWDDKNTLKDTFSSEHRNLRDLDINTEGAEILVFSAGG